MKKCNLWMLFGCAVLIGALWYFSGTSGVAVPGAVLVLLMVGCCVLPMLFAFKATAGRRGCCADDKKGKQDSGVGGTAVGGKPSSETKRNSCH